MGEGNERVTVSMGDIRLNVERLKNGARVTVWCADGPPREVFAPDEPTPMDDEYLATNNEADNQDGVPERGQLASPGRIGGDKNARIAVCPECQSRDVSVSALNGRRNWCRACGNGYVADVEERRDPAQDAPDGSQAAEDGERGDDTPGDALESHPVADAALGAATMTCPQCGQPTDELRGNRCRACRQEPDDNGFTYTDPVTTAAATIGVCFRCAEPATGTDHKNRYCCDDCREEKP